MKFYFSGCRNVTVLSAKPESDGGGSFKRIIIAGVTGQHGGGTYSGEAAGLVVHVDPPNGPNVSTFWSLTVENQNRFKNDVWEESPVVVTDSGFGIQIAANDDSQGTGPYDDLILLVAPCASKATGEITVPLLETWVSYGVMVDGGGRTGRGPVPPNNPNLLQFAAGLVLAEAAELVSSELRSGVLAIAANQIRLSAGRLAETIESA